MSMDLMAKKILEKMELEKGYTPLELENFSSYLGNLEEQKLIRKSYGKGDDKSYWYKTIQGERQYPFIGNQIVVRVADKYEEIVKQNLKNLTCFNELDEEKQNFILTALYETIPDIIDEYQEEMRKAKESQ